MSLCLILGRAGSGKTEQCMEEAAAAFAAEPQGQYLLITPEQATFTSEKRILKTLGGRGGFNVRVLSFRRFVWSVLQETGGCLGMPLDSAGKRMIIRSLLEQRKDRLKRFRLVYHQNGFLEQLVSLMDELRSYHIGAEDIRSCLQDMLGDASDPVRKGLKDKLADLELLFGEYCEVLSSGWLDQAGELSLLCSQLPLWPALGHTKFWIDGFHGFTPAEYEVISALLQNGCQVRVTLNLPKGRERTDMSEEEVFYPAWETARDLQALCRKAGVEVLPPLYLNEPALARFAASPALASLEHVLAFPGKPVEYAETVPAINLQGYSNMQQEAEGAAGQILRAIQEDGLRYHDLAVLIRQPENYRSILQSVFAAYDIPFFFDSPETMSYHPLICLMRTLLRFAEDRWNHQAVFAYAKTGMAGLSMAQCDRLENLCLAHGIRRGHWESSQPWEFDEAAEALRQRLWQPLSCFCQKISAAVDMRQMVTAVYEHLAALQAEPQCRRLAAEARQAGRVDEAMVHESAWSHLMDLFDQAVAFMGDQPLERQAFAKILQGGLDAMESLKVPPALDQVTVSSMDRSRTPQVKRVWILGANEGVLPARLNENGLLSSQERQWLGNHRISMAPDAEKRLFSESYLIYIALTRASEGLHISYPRADHEGKGQAPSPLLDFLCRRFPALSVREEPMPAEAALYRPKPALQTMSAALQNPQPAAGEIGLWRYVYAWFSHRAQWHREMERIRQGLQIRPLPPQIPAALSRELYGRVLKTSVTRLELFQACPFSHFVSYGLGLAARETYEIQAPEVGTFFHDSLEALLRSVQTDGQDLAGMAEAHLEERIRQIVADQMARSQNMIFSSTAWYKALTGRLHRILRRAALVLAEHERRGQFRPMAMELAFGTREPDSLPPLVLDLNNGCQAALRGRIDRIDQAWKPGDESPYVRIVDYKSGFNRLNLWEVYYGLKLQLILYLDVALTAAQRAAKPAGVFYFHVADPMLRTANALSLDDARRNEQVLKQLKLQGLVLEDKEIVAMMDREIAGSSLVLPVRLLNSGEFDARSAICTEEGFQRLRHHARNIMIQAADRMLEGDIQAAPFQAKQKKACEYCEFASICRFDPSIPGHRYRSLEPMKDTQVWRLLTSQEEPHEPLE
jgi:ATP-dependent helicase/nuclease subunit B